MYLRAPEQQQQEEEKEVGKRENSVYYATTILKEIKIVIYIWTKITFFYIYFAAAAVKYFLYTFA